MRHLAGTARPYVAVRVALKSSAKNTKDYISVNTNGKTKNINWTFNWTWQTSQFVNHNSLPTRNLQSFLSTLPVSPCLSLPAASTCCDRSVVRSCSKDWIRWKSCLHQNMWAESQRSWGMLGDVWKQWKQPTVGERLNFGQIMSKFWNTVSPGVTDITLHLMVWVLFILALPASLLGKELQPFTE